MIFAWFCAGAQAATGLDVKKGIFTVPASTGTQTITVGFEPKVAFFWYGNHTTSGSFQANAAMGYGWAVSSATQYALGVTADDSGATNQAKPRFVNDAAIVQITDENPGVVVFQADLAESFATTATGFKLNWSVVSSGITIHYMALGGSGITNVFSGDFTAGAATGNVSETGVGFQPDYVQFLSDGKATAFPGTAGKQIMVGHAISSTNRAVTGVVFKAEQTKAGKAGGSQRTDRAILAEKGNATEMEADFVSMDANGFTVNVTLAKNDFLIAYLAIEGTNLNIALGSETQNTSAGTKATSGLGFQPEAIMFYSWNNTASASSVADAKLTIGGSDGTDEDALWAGNEDNPTTDTKADTYINTTKALMMGTPGATPSLDAEADLSSFDSGGFTLDWTTADTTAREFIYLSFGGTSTGGGCDAANFTYRKSITIDYTKVSGSSGLTDYPALIAIGADDDLRTTANGGKVEDPDGDDIVFKELSGDCLDFEIEKYDASEGEVTAWVRIPTLSGTTDTVIYMHYESSGVTNSQENAAGVWDSNHLGVWHLHDTVTDEGTAADAHNDSSGSNHGDQYGNYQTGGQIANGQDLDANDYMDFGGSPIYDGLDQMTFSMWIYGRSWPGVSVLGGNWDHDVDNKGFVLYWYTNNLIFEIYDGARKKAQVGYTTTNTWTHVVGVAPGNGNGTTRIYVNGTETSGVNQTGTITNTTDNVVFGKDTNTANRYFDGLLDEVRISNIARSADWIKTSYNNQSSPSTFYNISTETVLTAVGLEDFTAEEIARGFLLRWSTGYEMNNLGFHVYREEGVEKEALKEAGPEERVPEVPVAPGQEKGAEAPPSPLAQLEGKDVSKSKRFEKETPWAMKDFLRRVQPRWRRSAGLSALGRRVAAERLDALIRERLEGLSAREVTASAGSLSDLDAASTKILEQASSSASSSGGSSGSVVPALTAVETQWELASGRSVKLSVREEGWYRVGQPELVAAGLSAGLDPGKLQLYMGHGSVEIWRGNFFTSSDALALTNSPRLPFFVSMTCLNGFFQDIYTESLAEALLRSKQGGAVAVWASSGLSDAGGQAIMNRELYRLLFNGEKLTIGEATMRAKRVVTDNNIRKTWILFGDPTTTME